MLYIYLYICFIGFSLLFLGFSLLFPVPLLFSRLSVLSLPGCSPLWYLSRYALHSIFCAASLKSSVSEQPGSEARADLTCAC